MKMKEVVIQVRRMNQSDQRRVRITGSHLFKILVESRMNPLLIRK